MFRYLIAPKNESHTTILLALTVTDDVITGYLQQDPKHTWLEKLPLVGSYFRSGSPSEVTQLHFHSCLYEYQKKHNIRFIHQNDLDHSSTHSTDKDEIDVQHTHLKHRKKIRLKTLDTFLKELKQCEEVRKLPKGESFLNHNARKDILREYEKFYKANRFGTHTSTSSNVEEYKELSSMPTIAEHVQCLEASSSTLGCTLDNPHTPMRLLPPSITSASNTTSLVSNDYSSYAALGVVALLTLGIGLFASRKQGEPAEEKETAKAKMIAVIKKRQKKG